MINLKKVNHELVKYVMMPVKFVLAPHLKNAQNVIHLVIIT